MAIVVSHAVICCLGTRILARLQTVYVVLNVLWVQLLHGSEINTDATLGFVLQ